MTGADAGGPGAVPLVGAIEALRVELRQALGDGPGGRPDVEVQQVELTLRASVDFTEDGTISWSVVTVGTGGDSSAIQTLKLTLTAAQASIANDLTPPEAGRNTGCVDTMDEAQDFSIERGWDEGDRG